MKCKQTCAILALAILIGVVVRQTEINAYHQKIEAISSMACDVVQLKAQEGSTRDVHDQVFSFLRKRSPDPRASVIVRNGAKEVGAQITENQSQQIEFNCLIENAPEYRIKMSFHALRFFSFDFIQWSFGFFVVLISIFFLSKSFMTFAAKVWSREILDILRHDLGLTKQGEKPKTNGLLPYIIQRFGVWISGRLGTVKLEIGQLKSEIEAKNLALQDSNNVLMNQTETLAKARIFEEKVRMVKHDLKSPLSSMKFAIFNKSNEAQVLPEIISTIEKILNDLESTNLNSGQDAKQNLKTEILEVTIKQVLEQKQLELIKNQKIQIDFNYDQQALSAVLVRPDYLSRVFSNLLQNSIEAIGNTAGQIQISVRHENNFVKIIIQDSGPGIPSELKDKVFEQGATFGKSNGTGLGLHFVKTCFNAWGGDVSIETVATTQRQGACFELSLPLLRRLNGIFIGPKQIRSQNDLILVDDEPLQMKKAWAIPQTLCFSTPQQFIEWWEPKGKQSAYPLVIDLHFSQHINGLDILREIGPRKETYLSTSDFMNQEMIETALDLGIRIIPKQLL